jgi:hypothetical protein
MLPIKRLLAAITVVVGGAFAGCGGSEGGKITSPSRIDTRNGNIVLTELGAQQIGLQTAVARQRGPQVVIPFSAVVYDPNGRTYAFTNPARLTFKEVRVKISRINGNAVYLRMGPAAGARVVTVGAEELFGVQTGVLAQT